MYEQLTIFDELKSCTKCGATAPATPEFFHRDKNRRDGLTPWCKRCAIRNTANWQQVNKESRSEYQKRYREENAERLKLSRAEFYRANRERLLEMGREHYYANREKNLELSRQWRRDNPETFKAGIKAWCAANPERFQEIRRASVQRRLARKAKLPHDLTAGQWRACIAYFGGCAYCGVTDLDLEREHFIALSSRGGYTQSNILPACGPCNRSKHDNDFFDWYSQRECYSDDRKEKILRYLEEVA